MLCCVLAVHPLAIVVSMCDQLLGHVPVTSVSEKLTDRLQRTLDDDEDEETAPELHELFSVGQWVRACVESVRPAGVRAGVGREGGEYERESQRVQLTLEPRAVNEGIQVSDLCAGYTLSAAVSSCEDHGYTLALGLDDDVHGFLSHRDAPGELHEGAVVLVNVARVDGRVVHCLPTTTAQPISVAPQQDAMLPGVCVRALVTAHVPQGLSVKLFGMHDGTIDNFHLPPGEAVAPGARIVARVLWSMPAELGDEVGAVGARRLGLSAAPHVVSLATPLAEGAPLPQTFPIGATLRVQVTSVYSEWGLVCAVPSSDVRAFVHIARVSDEHINALAPTTGPYRVGSEHDARVIGHAMTDRLLLLSLQPSVLARQFMRVSEVPVGEVVRGTVRRVTPQGIFVRLSGHVDGVVFPLHFSDARLQHPEKKYKPNLDVKARVLYTDPTRNRIALTLKRSLVGSELPFVSSLEDAVVGVVTHGTVVTHRQASLLVELGGGVRAVVPYSEASDTASTPEQLAELYPLGKTVKVRLTIVERESGRIVASIRQASPAFLEKLNVDAVSVGDRVDARVAAVRDDVVIAVLEPAGTRALLALSSLASARQTDVDDVRASLCDGALLSGLYVERKNAAKGLVVLSAEAPGAAVKPGARLTGRVISRNDAQLTSIVALHGTPCRARLHKTECADTLMDAELPTPGTEVEVAVLEVRKNGRDADVSLRTTREGADPAIESPAQLEPGRQLRAVVKAVSPKGVWVALGRKVDARVMIKELFDEYVKDFESRFHVGQVVEGTVLQVEPSGKVEFSLKKSRLVKEPSSRKARLADYVPGTKVTGFVRGVTDYGVFVQIAGTEVSGLAHRSELSDNRGVDAVRAFAVGDRVKAVVLKVDADKRKISFGLKPSYFDAADYEGEDEEDEDKDEGEDEEDEDKDEDEDGDDEDDVGIQEDEDDEVDEDLGVDGDEDVGAEPDDLDKFQEDDEGQDELDVARLVEAEDEDEVDDEDVEERDDEDDEDVDMEHDDDVSQDDDDAEDFKEHADYVDDSASDSDAAEPARPTHTYSLQENFRWGAAPAGEEDESSDEEAAPRSKPRKSAAEDITAELASKKLESATDYERLLLGSPNSSYLWIQFMSYYLQLGDVDKARQVGRRALQVINYREEQEKLNVWIALLNIENMYGTPDTLDGVFREAVQVNDALEVHLRLLAILEQSDKIDETAALFKRTAKKFGFVPHVWIQYYQFFLRHDRADEAHELVSRSLQSLERTKHLRVLTGYALAEYKLGDVEHARTLFETLVARHPKRLDLWWQYIDQEVRLNNLAGARSLMERVFVARRHSTKQVKALLQKWLVIEKRIGDEEGVQTVLERARAFVASVQDKSAGRDDADDDDEE